MLREHEAATSTADLVPEVAPPEPEAAAQAEFATEGPIPEVAQAPAVESQATASEQAFGQAPAAVSPQLDRGLYEPEAYHAACLAAGTPDKWRPEYVHGYTSAKQWTQPRSRHDANVFELKRGESASQAVKDFLAGPTIAGFGVLHVALEMDALRDTLGDNKFDHMFGSADGGRDAQIPPGQRLKITPGMYTIPFAQQMLELAEQTEDAARPAEPEAPAAAARIEDQPREGGITAPSPEVIADELGLQREQDLA